MCKYDAAMKRLDETFGNKDCLISLSTIALEPGADGQSRPAARLVDAYYEAGAFYIVTNAASGKMRQIARNPAVAICFVVDNFTADGIGENLGWVCEERNAEMMTKLRDIFAAWYYVANNEENRDVCLLRVRMTKGLWYDAHKGIRNEIDFVNQTAD